MTKLKGQTRILRGRGGFALVATLTMMLLLVILGVGLLSLSAISLRSSGHGAARQMAQANARLGLMLALGQLQEAAGGDLAVTAPANIATAPDGEVSSTPAAAAKGLVPPQPGSRYWTGVWTNSLAPADAATKIYTQTPGPRLKRWLVSGGESEEIAPNSPRISLGGNGDVAAPDKAVLVVGRGTTGGTGPDAAENFVTVPLVEVAGPGKRPGGRYGWWVGDEGVKTRFNLPSEELEAAAEVTYASLGSRGGGWETVAGLSAYPSRGSGNESLLARVLSLPSAALVDPGFSGGNSALKQGFHDITTDSRGLLTDSLNGGLKLDLTRYLEDGFPATPDLPLPQAASATTNIIPKPIAPGIKGPPWERLREFYALHQSLQDGALLVKAAKAENELTIAPILLDFRLLMGARLVPQGETQNYAIHPCGKVAVTLANPYPHPLVWERDLEFEVFNVSPSGNSPSRIWDAAGQPAFIPANPSELAVFNNAVFIVPSGRLEPGEALAYTIPSPVPRSASTAKITVRLGPFSSSSPDDFSNSIVMSHSGVNNGSKSLDVRESWTTSLIAVELRLSGGPTKDSILRRVERLELDNAFWAETRRNVDAALARKMTRPFPLHLFSFQISQPGVKYGTVLPNSNLLGTRNSTLRTFMDFNLQAKRFIRPIATYNAPPYFMESSDSLGILPFIQPGGSTGNGFTRNLAISPVAWGSSPSGPKSTILFSPPDQLVSLAQLQHADLTADDLGSSIGHQPGNAVGNSYAPPFVKRTLTTQRRIDYQVLGSPNRAGVLSESRNYYDLSYLLNSSLWDTYFLSTIPTTGSPEPLNKRLRPMETGTNPAALRSATLAASQLWIQGAFNVNSSRKDAWKALLASTRDLKHPSPLDSSEGTLFPRSLAQTGSAETPQPTGTKDDSFNGFRRLTDDQLDALAGEITRQVHLRGPFVSLSHFVNRALIDLSRDPNGLGRSGALQSAIDESGLNLSPSRTDSGFTGLTPASDRVTLLAQGNFPRACLDGPRSTEFPNSGAEPVWASQSKDLNPGSIASILADRPMLTNPRLKLDQGFRSTGIPGWLTQADILQVIGPVLTVRSDTFRIRSYGEAHDASGRPAARAWCEAIVQRTPSYVEPSDGPGVRINALSEVNSRFGRRFEIVSFRWLSPDEI